MSVECPNRFRSAAEIIANGRDKSMPRDPAQETLQRVCELAREVAAQRELIEAEEDFTVRELGRFEVELKQCVDRVSRRIDIALSTIESFCNSWKKKPAKKTAKKPAKKRAKKK